VAGIDDLAELLRSIEPSCAAVSTALAHDGISCNVVAGARRRRFVGSGP
jgi:hypothetical protein